ncbi:hypothetical protein LEMLEM_LOCUS10414 [Lemmus lemmus]
MMTPGSSFPLPEPKIQTEAAFHVCAVNRAAAERADPQAGTYRIWNILNSSMTQGKAINSFPEHELLYLGMFVKFSSASILCPGDPPVACLFTEDGHQIFLMVYRCILQLP